MKEGIIFREFELNCDGSASALWRFLKLNWRALSDQGKPLWVICTNDAKKRNNQQNSRYWGFVLPPISEQAFVDGRRFSSMAWHEFFAEKYCPHIEIPLPDGTIRRRRKSTSELTVSEFSEYMNLVEAEAACEFGVRFSADPRVYGGKAA